MKWFSFLKAHSGKRNLKDFIRLVLAFYGCLLLLALYQQVRLYEQGVLDGFLNKNLLLLSMHHLGFTAVLALPLAFLFNYLEAKKPGMGFRGSIVVLMGGLLWEMVLTEYFIDQYEVIGLGAGNLLSQAFSGTYMLLTLFLASILFGSAFRLFYRLSKRINRLLSGMYPFTVILFSLFLATLLSEKRPVNLNKTQYLAEEYLRAWSNPDTYDGAEPYPFYSDWEQRDALGQYLDWPDQPPHIVVIAIEGLSADFVGEGAAFRAFTPFLDSLSRQGLYWNHFVSNVRESKAAMPLITGSVPYGRSGFTAEPELPARLTLFSLLKKNGYRTSFQYGGNASLAGWDRFLLEERVDELADRKSFGESYSPQEADRAGVSLGYPDEALFDRYLKTRTPGTEPRLDVFQTLSSAEPYLIPEAETYRELAEQRFEAGSFGAREERIVKKNMDFMAAMIYTDQQLKRFFREASKSSGYHRTLFVVTGTHHPVELAANSLLQSYQVPLIVFSPMLRQKQTIDALASHLDIAPSLLGSLGRQYQLELPERASWLGSDWMAQRSSDARKVIPLYEASASLRNLVVGEKVISGSKCYAIDARFELTDVAGGDKTDLKAQLRLFRSLNRYAVEEDGLMPRDMAPYGTLYPRPDKKEMVWIHSVFNGPDIDNAYTTARQLAMDGNYDRASLLCRFILSEVPSHVDTEILLGRIYAWQAEYDKAAELLEQVVQKYPVYADGYSALLDVYYWSGQDQKSLYLKPAVETHLKSNREISEKLARSALRLLSASDSRISHQVREFAISQLTQNSFE